jgi:hypothetical protein
VMPGCPMCSPGQGSLLEGYAEGGVECTGSTTLQMLCWACDYAGPLGSMGLPKMSSDILCRSINMMEETYLVDNIKEQVLPFHGPAR